MNLFFFKIHKLISLLNEYNIIEFIIIIDIIIYILLLLKLFFNTFI